ncbi:subclass B3 metallo-beta-lactamase [Qipengyuania sp. XHP0207]|uniref:subclass B3 metallo-beta-lactamase n=1 Tax=Qipengyuania sp. XHP0207 TaxID=3038078 RepID=UPI00241F7E26|nr:subclass B3 metallo-beta-lactamase [Qipengyuania sp. XHP0207]MDG5747391.1 subclass B3 metallo-beta-lactamase [Qipengyuania sp. XHP0207]
MFARPVALLLLAGCTSAQTAQPAAMPALLQAGFSSTQFAEQCEPWDEWDKPAPPFRILGNSWYVGTCGIASILIADPAGHVLIDSGTETGAEVILANLRTISVEPTDVRYILASHEHFDHVGGHAVLAEATGAEIVALAEAAPVLESGKVSPDDPQAAAGHPNMTPVAVARIVADGEVLTLGDISITAHATPGHSPGATSWTWTACTGPEEPPVCRRLAYVDSLSPVSADSYRFGDHPDVVAAFRASLAKVAALPCDELLTPHPSASQLIEKLRSGSIAVAGQCQAYARALGERLDKRLAEEAASD